MVPRNLRFKSSKLESIKNKRAFKVKLKNNKSMSDTTFKGVSATFLLVCFVYLNKSTCETKKNVIYFTSKVLSVFEIIKFELFRYSNVMTSSNA